MPERDDTADDGFHEIQLSGKQVIFLVMATTAVLIFAFLVGVRVGRDVTQRGDEAIGAAMVAPSGAQGQAGAGTPPADPPPPQEEAPLSYHDRLQNNAPSTEKPAQPEAQKDPKPQAEPQAERLPSPPAQVPPPASAPAAAGAAVPTSGRPGTWVLQVMALKDRAPAASMVQRLVAKGYPAFLDSSAGGLHRVRIGRYKDRREAEQVNRRLEKEEQLESIISR